MPDARHTVDGVRPSAITVPRGDWPDALSFLVAHFPNITAYTWRQRFALHRVLDDNGQPLAADAPCREGLRLHYFREVVDEPPAFSAWRVVHRDAHLLVIDKPPFVPVTPAGRFVQQSLLVQLQRETDIVDVAPLHRIDRLTAGLVMFSLRSDSRAHYQRLFANHAINKGYDALSATRVGDDFPRRRMSRLARGEPFFRRQEVKGQPNSETVIEVTERGARGTRFRLMPVTGRTHQLRVHMAALGAPLLNDPWYPDLLPPQDDNPDRPLQLVARSLTFTDPLTGATRFFESAYRCVF